MNYPRAASSSGKADYLDQPDELAVVKRRACLHELLGPGHLAREPQLREAREPRAHDEPLPVGGDVLAQFDEEARSDRARPHEAHVAAQDVVELRQLVELERAQRAPGAGQLPIGQPAELLAEERAQPPLGVGPQRPELVHAERLSGTADARPAIQDRPPRRQHRQRTTDHQRGQHDESRCRQRDVEPAQRDVDRPRLEVVRDAGVVRGQRFTVHAGPARGLSSDYRHAASMISSTSTRGSRPVIAGRPGARLTSSSAHASVSGRSRPARISPSSTPPRRPP